jgi:hypothetical protein
MMDHAVHPASGEGSGPTLRAALARGDAVADAAQPILRYLLTAEAASFFTEDVLTRVRGLLADLSGRIVAALTGDAAGPLAAPGEVEMLADALADRPAILGHVHALSIEWQVAERLHGRLALDPVVSPLVQALASDEGEARAFLTAQARWCQAQRRMQLPLAELSRPVRDAVFATARLLIGSDAALLDRLGSVERETSGDSPSRLELASALAAGPELSIAEAGVSLFLSGLARASSQPRDTVALALHESQRTRLALLLLGAGVQCSDVMGQLLILHPEAPLPEGLATVTPGEAAALLAPDGMN